MKIGLVYVVLILLIAHKSVFGAPKPRPRGTPLSKRSPRTTTNVYNYPVENTFNSDGSDDSEDKSYSASVQFMITNKMKNTLVNQLGYLPSEVDEMEPQIAAVVIERSLPRPTNGMPASWKRPNSRMKPGFSPTKWLSGIQTTLLKQYTQISDSIKYISIQYIRPALPILLLGSILWFQGDNLVSASHTVLSASQQLLHTFWKRLTTRSPTLPPPPPKQASSDGSGLLQSMKSLSFLPKSAASPASEAAVKSIAQPSYQRHQQKINLSGLEKVVSQSWWERLAMKSKARSYGG